MIQGLNSAPFGQNGCHFADKIFKRIFLNENILISNKISLKYVPWVLIDNMSALVQIMAWHHGDDKPLSEPMLTHFTWGKWVKQSDQCYIDLSLHWYMILFYLLLKDFTKFTLLSPLLQQLKCPDNFMQSKSDFEVGIPEHDPRPLMSLTWLLNRSHLGGGPLKVANSMPVHDASIFFVSLSLCILGHINACGAVLRYTWNYTVGSVMVVTAHYGMFMWVFNPLHAKFFRGNKNIYLHFMSFLHIDMMQVVEILPQVRPGRTYST